MKNGKRTIQADEAVIRILQLLEQKGIKQKDLMEYLGINPSTFARWKFNNGKTYLKYLEKIARFLDTTQEYLLYGISGFENEKLRHPMTVRDIQLMKMLREIDNQEISDAIYLLVESIWADHHPQSKTGS